MSDDGAFDVAVIGAGINGAGIARDAALRGLLVIVLDQNDMQPARAVCAEMQCLFDVAAA